MKAARLDSKLFVAGPDALDRAICPDCGTEVHKRHRTCMDGSVTYHYRHKRGRVKGCARRYGLT